MSCSIKDRVENDIDIAMTKFIGNATSFDKVNNTVVMKASEKFTKNQLYIIAQKNVQRVSAWAEKEYGVKFINGWTSIDDTLWNQIIVRFRVPPVLRTAWEVQDEQLSIEEANERLLLPDIGNDFFMGDNLLREQYQREVQSDSEFYNEYASTTGERLALSKQQTKEWKYDKNKEVEQFSLFDDELYDNLSDKLNIC
jgi:hypothetical protein